MAADGLSQWRPAVALGLPGRLHAGGGVGGRAIRFVFKSLDGGDLEIMGMISFHAVKANLTEIDLVVNYESQFASVSILLDRTLKVGDHFLVNQLRRVRAHFEGIAAPGRSQGGSLSDGNSSPRTV